MFPAKASITLKDSLHVLLRSWNSEGDIEDAKNTSTLIESQINNNMDSQRRHPKV